MLLPADFGAKCGCARYSSGGGLIFLWSIKQVLFALVRSNQISCRNCPVLGQQGGRGPLFEVPSGYGDLMLEIASHHVVDDLMGPDEYGDPNQKGK